MRMMFFALLALAVSSCGYNTYHITVKNDSGVRSFVSFDGNTARYTTVLAGEEIRIANLAQTELRGFVCSNKTGLREYDFAPYDNWFAASVHIRITIGTNSIGFDHGNWKAKR